MKAAYCTANNESANCAKLLGTVTNAHHVGLISDNISLISSGSDDCGLDTCSFYSGPSDDTIMAFGESCGSIAYSGEGESSGSIAFSGGESCGSIASTGMSSCSSGSSACSYSC